MLSLCAFKEHGKTKIPAKRSNRATALPGRRTHVRDGQFVAKVEFWLVASLQENDERQKIGVLGRLLCLPLEF